MRRLVFALPILFLVGNSASAADEVEVRMRLELIQALEKLSSNIQKLDRRLEQVDRKLDDHEQRLRELEMKYGTSPTYQPSAKPAKARSTYHTAVYRRDEDDEDDEDRPSYAAPSYPSYSPPAYTPSYAAPTYGPPSYAYPPPPGSCPPCTMAYPVPGYPGYYVIVTGSQ